MRSAPRRSSAWFGFAHLIPTGKGTLRLKLRWGRIGLAFFTLCLMGYLSAAFGLYYLFKQHRGFSELRFTDVLFLQRTELRERQGEADIARAIEALERGSGREAFNFLRTGVGRAPENLEGRLLLIQFYMEGYPQLAEDLFRRGMAFHADNPDYRYSFAQFLVHRRKDVEATALIEEGLSADSGEVSDAVRLASLGMTLANLRGNFGRAMELYEEYSLGKTERGVLEAVHSLIRTGRPDDAITLLEAGIRNSDLRHHLSLYHRLIELYLKAERYDAASDLALQLSLQAPLEWQPRIMLLRIWQLSGQDPQHLRREFHALMEQFSDNPSAITSLAHFAREYGLLELGQAVYTFALEQGQEFSTYTLILLETTLRAGAYEKTLAFSTELETESPPWLERHLAEYYSMRSIAAFATGNRQLGTLYQREFLREARRRPELIRLIALSFQRADLNDVALTVLEHAHELAPENEAVLADLIQLQLQLRESRQLTQRVRTLLGLRRPDYAVFEHVWEELNSERPLFRRDTPSLLLELAPVLAEIRQVPTGSNLAIPD